MSSKPIKTNKQMLKHLGDVCEERDEMKKCLETLVSMYVANCGDIECEFISCITPFHASDMTKKQRKADKTWAAWDKARSLISM